MRPFLIISGAAKACACSGTARPFINFVWVRAHTLFNLLTPNFFAIYPFELRSVITAAPICLPGAVGLIIIGPALVAAAKLRDQALVWLGAVLPGVMIIGAFSYPAIVGVSGFQAIIAALVVLGLQRMRRTVRPTLFGLLIVLQFLLNLALLVATGYLAGVHFY